MTNDQLTRFLAKINPAANGCWLWTGAMMPNGYGRCTVAQVGWLPHRLAYEYFVGRIPSNKEIDHLCRNRACVNPTHMEPVTHVVNMRRGTAGERIAELNRSRRGLPQTAAQAKINVGRKHDAQTRANMRAAWVRRKASAA